MAIEMENVVDYSNQTRSSGESLTSAREEEKKIDYQVQTTENNDQIAEDAEKGGDKGPE